MSYQLVEIRDTDNARQVTVEDPESGHRHTCDVPADATDEAAEAAAVSEAASVYNPE